MAVLVTRRVTLTDKNDSGPFYNVMYSTDCINYVESPNGQGVYLPSDGASVQVLVDENTTCIKLVSTGQCATSFISQSGEVSSTTTIAPYTVYKAERTSPLSFISVTYIDPWGANRSSSWTSDTPKYFVARSISNSANATITNLGSLTEPNQVYDTGSLFGNDSFITTVTNPSDAFVDIYYFDGETETARFWPLSSFDSKEACMLSGSLMFGANSLTGLSVSESIGNICAVDNTRLYIDNTGYNDYVCAFDSTSPTNTSLYFDSSTTFSNVKGKTAYTDDGLVNIFNGNNKWYPLSETSGNTNASKLIFVNQSGLVVEDAETSDYPLYFNSSSYEFVLVGTPKSITYIDPYGIQRTYSDNSSIPRSFVAQSIVSSVGTITTGSILTTNEWGKFETCSIDNTNNCNVTVSMDIGNFSSYAYWLDDYTGLPQVGNFSNFAFGGGQTIRTSIISGSLVVPRQWNTFEQEFLDYYTITDDCTPSTTTTTTTSTSTTSTTTTTTLSGITDIWSDTIPRYGNLQSCGCTGETGRFNFQVLGNGVNIYADMTGRLVYEDYDTNTIFIGDDLWYCITDVEDTETTISIQINNFGFITDWVDCSTTTTTTTTSTTTTTTGATGCYEYLITCPLGNPLGCNVQYTDCNGDIQSYTQPDDTDYPICARPTPTVTGGFATFLGDCGLTTTTTTSTTSTTTATPLRTWYGSNVDDNSDNSCNFGPQDYPNEYKHNGSIAYPRIGNTVYYSNGSPFDTEGWYWIATDDKAIQVNSSGVVIDLVDCTGLL
jgi:hypothetical protein